MKKLSILILLTGILLLIGNDYSWSQEVSSKESKAQSKFKKIDTDGDGKINREEHLKDAEKRAEKNFKHMDVSKDGYLSFGEFMGTSKKKK